MSVINAIFRAAVPFALLLIFIGCHPRSHLLEPQFTYTPPKKFIENLTPDFKELNEEEKITDWGKELHLGEVFAKELDLYRAITCFKRSLILIPEDQKERKMQLEFHLIQSYYLGQKYSEAIEIFESGSIRHATPAFPAFRDLLIILYDCYTNSEECEKAQTIQLLMNKGDPETAENLKLFHAIDRGNIQESLSLSKDHSQAEDVSLLAHNFYNFSKSVTKARTLNAILPGVGYFYVGQKKLL